MSSSLELIVELWKETPAQKAWRYRCEYGVLRACFVAKVWLKTKATTDTERKYFREVAAVCVLQLRDALAKADLELTQDGCSLLDASDTLYTLRQEVLQEEWKEARTPKPRQMSLFN